MATLTRVREQPNEVQTSALQGAVPKPFPRERLVDVDDVEDVVQAGPSHVAESSDGQETASAVTELLPSIAFVERSCLMTLNNLLSAPSRWNPIVPDRRHSMPTAPHAASTSTEAESSSSALQTLVSNLRTRDGPDLMLELTSSDSDSDLLRELNTRIDSLSSSLDTGDARLAKSLVSLLSHLNRLSSLHSPQRLGIPQSWASVDSLTTDNMYDTLKRQLSDLQVERKRDILPPGSPAVLAVETALLWSKIDEELESVVAICKERTGMAIEHLPPQYDRADYEFDTPPEYDYQSRESLDTSKSHPVQATHSPTLPNSSMNEKMRLDFEAVTMAIDRLYLVAPQLHNQRVELKSSKLAQMEKARREGSVSRGKQKQKDVQELENIFEMLGRATDRTLKDQSVIVEGGMKTRFERARQRDEAKRAAFVDQLAEHSNSGRLHSQDAVLQPKTKDPNAMLTLPEFIRESIPDMLRSQDPTTMMTLPEFVKHVPPPDLIAPPISASASLPPVAAGGTLKRLTAKKKNRDRSMSAPSLSWLRPSPSKSNLNDAKAKESSRSSTPKVEFEINYIAENHESLHHVLVFLSVAGAMPGVDLEAEVLPSFPDTPSEGGDRLIIKSGHQSSLPLPLPGRVLPGKKDIKVQSGHYEIKLTSIPVSAPPPQPAPLLDATQLSATNPTSFICASCSLPVIHSSRISRYRDLPSEHWQELVDAWMCHSDQKLHEHVGQALVGGSYILFDESAVSKTNIHSTATSKRADDWHPIQESPSSAERKPMVYRMLKYAIRPANQTPLSAFVIEDMTEFVQAHASYRFVVLDEEDERPRILMWLFKPSIPLAYATRSHYSLPKAASMQAAKVLFKLVGPSEEPADLKTILDKYPGFPQAEYLFYPMNVCRQLAALLRESNRTYPESMRTMTGLEVGWLRRS
ncbi:hypothetical protein BDZ89DRAFT_1061342 [Hymenopellis radicata]|nr:hypothetical protein BDZ89DRAFT_1061342 [Hymenopellis radicata]